jgi:hypothetical protein
MITHTPQSILPQGDNIDDNRPDLSESNISLDFVLSIFNGDYAQFFEHLTRHFDSDGKRILDLPRLEQHLRKPYEIVYCDIRAIFFNCVSILSTYGKSTDVVDAFIHYGQSHKISADDILCWNFYLPYPEISHYLWSQGYTLSPQALHLREEGLHCFYQFVQEHDLPYFPLAQNKEDSDKNSHTIELYLKHNQKHNQLQYSFNIVKKLQQEQHLFREQAKVQLYLKLKDDLEPETINIIEDHTASHTIMTDSESHSIKIKGKI